MTHNFMWGSAHEGLESATPGFYRSGGSDGGPLFTAGVLGDTYATFNHMKCQWLKRPVVVDGRGRVIRCVFAIC